MPIGLTAKIEPKNDGFVGIVDADQVIGASGNGGYLHSSAISANSIYEPNLKISNSPNDGYYLQYKDSTDKLTWAEVSQGDSSGSAALQWLNSSGQAYDDSYKHSSNAKNLFYPSSTGNNLNTSYVGHSSNSEIHRRTAYGWANNLADGGNIAHGLGTKPSYVSVVPSGNTINFGIAWTVDDTNITVSYTAEGSRNVNWIAEV